MSPEIPALVSINIGNTNTTAVAWSSTGHAGALEKWPSDFRSLAAVAKRAADAREVLMASVVKQCSRKLTNDLLALGRQVHIFRGDIPAPLEIAPQPSERVGDDRVAACLGALQLDAASPWVVVDAGTAVTVNAVRPAEGGKLPCFEGGLIAPGAALCLRALGQGTSQLPGMGAGAFEKNGFDFIGRNTEQAMLFGVLALQASAVTAMIEGQRALLGKTAKVAITGGGAGFLLEAIRSANVVKFEFVHQPNLVHLGLFASWKQARGIR